MKITDLMIGDWVQYNGHPVKVHALNVSDGYAIIEDQVSVELTKDTCMSIDTKRLEPILLTPEILEKNGFEKVNESVFRIYNYSANLYIGINFDEFKNNIPIIYLLDNNTNSWPGYHQYDLFDCQYVHEFQHALKQYKIEKEIVL